MSKPLAILVDINNALYRYYHTQGPRVVNNQRVECVACVTSYFNRLKGGEVVGKPDLLIGVADFDGPNFRYMLSARYKADREPMAPELRSQESLVHQALVAMGVPVIKKEGVEGDDTIGMVANHLVSQGYRVVIVVSDKDILQLVSDNVQVYDPKRKQVMDAPAVKDYLGVMPNQVADYLAIVGDSTDGIVGLYGVGKVTAVKWLEQYGSLDKLLLNAHEVPNKAGDILRSGFSNLMLNRSLTRLSQRAEILTEEEISMLHNPQVDEAACRTLSRMYHLRLLPRAAAPALDLTPDMPPLPPVEAYENDPQQFQF